MASRVVKCMMMMVMKHCTAVLYRFAPQSEQASKAVRCCGLEWLDPLLFHSGAINYAWRFRADARARPRASHFLSFPSLHSIQAVSHDGVHTFASGVSWWTGEEDKNRLSLNVVVFLFAAVFFPLLFIEYPLVRDMLSGMNRNRLLLFLAVMYKCRAKALIQ